MPRLRRDSELIGEAVAMAYQAVDSGQGGPFGAVVCGPDGEVLVRTHNKVILQTDPTAHAEVTAIREVRGEGAPAAGGGAGCSPVTPPAAAVWGRPGLPAQIPAGPSRPAPPGVPCPASPHASSTRATTRPSARLTTFSPALRETF